MIRLSIRRRPVGAGSNRDELAPRHDSSWLSGVSPPSRPRIGSSPRQVLDWISWRRSPATSRAANSRSSWMKARELRWRASVDANEALRAARQLRTRIQRGPNEPEGSQEFFAFLENSVPRRLKEHQRKAALHLIATGNAANLSVPRQRQDFGRAYRVSVASGRSTLSMRCSLSDPPACFGPWRTEYEETLGRSPAHEILAGGDVENGEPSTWSTESLSRTYT